MTTSHTLVVHAEPDDGMDIDHPDTCPTELLWDGKVRARTCEFADLEMQYGLAEYFHREGTQGNGEAVTIGRHPIEYWTNGANDDRFECGLHLAQDWMRNENGDPR